MARQSWPLYDPLPRAPALTSATSLSFKTRKSLCQAKEAMLVNLPDFTHCHILMQSCYALCAPAAMPRGGEKGMNPSLCLRANTVPFLALPMDSLSALMGQREEKGEFRVLACHWTFGGLHFCWYHFIFSKSVTGGEKATCTIQ